MSKNRLLRPRYEFFFHWKMLTKFGFVNLPKNKSYKSIIFELIKKRRMIIKNMKDRSKPTFLTIHQQKITQIPNHIEPIEIFRKCLAFFELLKKKVEYNYREFFFFFQYRDFARVNENFGGKSVRGLT